MLACFVCHCLSAVAADTPSGGVRYKNSDNTDERHISRMGLDPVESSFVPASGTLDASIFIVLSISLPGLRSGELYQVGSLCIGSK